MFLFSKIKIGVLKKCFLRTLYGCSTTEIIAYQNFRDLQASRTEVTEAKSGLYYFLVFD